MQRRMIQALVLAGLAAAPAAAQGLNTDGTIDTIIGSEVTEKETTATADPQKVLAAIDRSAENAQLVRKLTQAKTVEIVFLSDSMASEGGPPAEIENRLRQRDAEVGELRKELEGNALLYYAIDSRQVLMRDILAIEFADDQSVLVYAAAKPPS